MDIEFVKEAYMSIPHHFSWRGIPAFAVLTGPNGIGKSQLLRAIGEELRARKPGEQRPHRVSISGQDFAPGDAVLLHGEWELRAAGANVNSVLEETRRLQNALRSGQAAFKQNDDGHASAERRLQVLQNAVSAPLGVVAWNDIKYSLPSDVHYSCRPELNQLSSELARVFLEYHLRRRDRCHDLGETEEGATRAMGTPPWQRFNDLLEASGLPFRCEAPTGGYDAQYSLTLIDKARGIAVSLASLSSGERTIIGLAIWLLASRVSLPRLLLLDEPDAHLHSAMIPGFIRTLEHMVSAFGVRIIVTSHRAETLIRAPEGSLFEMQRDGDVLQVRKVEDRGRAVWRLTSGLFAILNGIRCVLVEDEDDRVFYTLTHGILTQEGTTETVPLVFQSVAQRNNREASPGGKDAVKNWVSKLGQAGLTNIVRGLVDRDGAQMVADGVTTIDRYCFENYLIDPFVLYSHLLKVRKAPVVAGCNIRLGEERQIRLLSVEVAQALTDAVLKPLDEKIRLATLNTSTEFWTEHYITGLKVTLPLWLRETSGKQLIHFARELWGGSINHHELREAFERVAMVPTRLRDALAACAS